MSEYGLTKQGPNPKRLDVIIEEMHKSLSAKLGVNTRSNEESLLNHLIVNFADRIAELWEYGTDIYHSQYPTSAEGISLDQSAEYGGVIREMSAPSRYNILCKGYDGTTIPNGTLLATKTNPVIQVYNEEDGEITRSKFNKIVIKPSTTALNLPWTASINNQLYTYTPNRNKSLNENIEIFSRMITDDAFTVKYEDGKIYIDANDPVAEYSCVLSENLTTENVSTLIVFSTKNDGDIFVPNDVIAEIVQSVAGLLEVTNVGSYVAGRKLETDTEFRDSYIDKIYNRSSNMLESIKSRILSNVQGVRSVSPYENYTNVTDSEGRPPHSIEVVVDGGSATEIAKQIWNAKAGGISTYGSEEVVLKGKYGEDITVRFNRPAKVYAWFKVVVAFDKDSNVPVNYVELVENVIIGQISKLNAGDNVVTQKLIQPLFDTVPNVDFFDIKVFTTEDESYVPDEDEIKSVVAEISNRQLATTDAERIEVSISD